MRKVKEVLRLRFGLGLRQNQIARSCSIGQATVHRYLEKAAAAGLSWPLPEDWMIAGWKNCCSPARGRASQPEPRGRCRTSPKSAGSCRAHKHLTLQLLWEEYRETQPDGYGYSRFCELYERWSRNQDVVLRQEHRAGEKMFVDWAGDTIPALRPAHRRDHAGLVVRRRSRRQHLHLCASHAEPGSGELGRLPRCAPSSTSRARRKLIVPDNPRTGVDRACRYEPDLNRTYHEMAMHYGVAVMPARPRKPRDKAKVENAVLLAERWIFAALRHRKFFSLAELNEAIAELLEKLNHRPFRKREGSRASLFAELDRPALQPSARRTLRPGPLENRPRHDRLPRRGRPSLLQRSLSTGRPASWRPASPPLPWRSSMAANASPRTCAASAAYRHTTVSEHMPKSHQAHLEWTPSRLIHWAESVGVGHRRKWSARFWRASRTRRWATAPAWAS